MKKSLNIILSIVLAWSLFSCSDSTIGTSIINSNLAIIADSSYTVSGQSVRNDKILTRTMTQLLGKIKVDNFGTLSSDYVCQFLPATVLDTIGMTVNDIESMRLILRSPVGSFTGDSVIPMRATAYRLEKQLSAPINSEFNPEGYYSESSIMGSGAYTATRSATPTYVHTSMEQGTYRNILINLPKKFAQDIYTEFLQNPATFQSTERFNEFFHGMYIANSYGSGRITMVDKTMLIVKFRRHKKTDEGNDTIVRDSACIATAAPEVITNNNIKLVVDEKIVSRVNNGEIIVQAPTGYEVNIKFPIREVLHTFNMEQNNLKVVNSLNFSVPAEELKNDYNIKLPTYLLLIRTSEKDKFFANNKVVDNINSFYATYNSDTKCYDFGNMREFFLSLKDATDEELEDATNLTLVPVDVTVESYGSSYYGTATTTVTSITPAVSRPMIGTINLDKAKIKFVYSKQKYGED